MTPFHLECPLDSQPETLERILRIVRTQGFNIVELRVDSHPEPTLRTTLRGLRSPHTLAASLARLTGGLPRLIAATASAPSPSGGANSE